MALLGIETSCDETAVALLSLGGEVLSHHIASQATLHESWGGVVPNLAARKHAEILGPLVEKAFKDAGLKPQDLKAAAATAGPGLIGSVMLGLFFTQTLALALDIPFIAINHLEAHGLVPRLNHDVTFPYLLLLISGGHSEFILMKTLGEYQLLGKSLDDALGETFDKVARLLNLGYPGGPLIERVALKGDREAFSLPTPLKGRQGCDFSFSGLKTAVADLIRKERLDVHDGEVKADLAASFQHSVGCVLKDRLGHAILMARRFEPSLQQVVVSGGVAANRMLFNVMAACVEAEGLSLISPPPELCTDNGLMVAWAGLERYRAKAFSSLEFKPRARWPLAEVSLYEASSDVS